MLPSLGQIARHRSAEPWGMYLNIVMDCQNTLCSFELYPFSSWRGGGVRSCPFACGIVYTPLFLLSLIGGLKMNSVLGSILDEAVQG